MQGSIVLGGAAQSSLEKQVLQGSVGIIMSKGGIISVQVWEVEGRGIGDDMMVGIWTCRVTDSSRMNGARGLRFRERCQGYDSERV